MVVRARAGLVPVLNALSCFVEWEVAYESL